MEAVLVSLLSGELSVTTLLLLFIIAILTKRFVPWWVYDALVAELKVYKEQAPDLIDEIQNMYQSMQEKEIDEKAALRILEKSFEVRKELNQNNEYDHKRTRIRPKQSSGVGRRRPRG